MLEISTLTKNKRRTVRSYVRRKGRSPDSRAEGVLKLWQQYGLQLDGELLDIESTFGRVAPLEIELGFGNGQMLLELAVKHPERDFIGIEVYSQGLAALLKKIGELKLQNIRLYYADAVEVLSTAIANDAVSKLWLLFPDPWPKAKHHKRRIVQPEFIDLVAAKLTPGGCLHMATDWLDYKQHMLQVMHARTDFSLSPTKVARPVTKFEQRGMRLGYNITDMVYQKV